MNLSYLPHSSDLSHVARGNLSTSARKESASPAPSDIPFVKQLESRRTIVHEFQKATRERPYPYRHPTSLQATGVPISGIEPYPTVLDSGNLPPSNRRWCLYLNPFGNASCPANDGRRR
ncbi:hypothetical protein POX_e06977 [Penicillium oxalicum]|uniref:hypothetical protein n=1 Tax=Penicillium oxalicum TaxID=69781 RepID=UPI0020B86646|nr:hypothetical protein POX_e06977 [Penicillium oxalicum]KAI2788952.1 hypothetical protein POX_e06977 [Penicillium oxalicum]